MHYTSTGMLLCMWLELASLLAPTNASPSFRFSKASSSQHDLASAPLLPSNSTLTASNAESFDGPFDAARLCPLSYSHKDAANERKMKHEVAKLKGLRLPEFTKVTIPIIFHIVSASNAVEGGQVTQRNIEQQVKVLNYDYAAANIAFKLEKVNRISNPGWFKDVGVNNRASMDMHSATREGDQKVLNVWTTSFSTVSFTGGYSQYPWDYHSYPKEDGVTIRHDFLYGSNHKLFHDGRYLTHEVGHWVGLYHTFEQENCDSTGDYVDDTPAQKSASDPTDKSCKARDTCKGKGGNDLISNFMDYSNPRCQTSFTEGQINRMRSSISQFRDYGY